jgi:hypothetical protein
MSATLNNRIYSYMLQLNPRPAQNSNIMWESLWNLRLVYLSMMTSRHTAIPQLEATVTQSLG